MRHLIHTDAYGHVWIFTWTEETVNKVIGRITAFAIDPQFTFSLDDAAVCCQRVRNINWSASRGKHEQKI